MSEHEKNSLAAKHFPHQWKEATEGSGQKFSRMRNKLRKYAAEAEVVDGLKDTGANCGNCQHFASGTVGNYCDIDSDFHRFSIVKRNHLCKFWKGKP